MNYFSKEIKEIAKTLIIESLGSFDNQIKIAEEIGGICYEMLKSNVERNVFDIDSDVIKHVDLTIKCDTPNYEITASINSLDSNGTIGVVISIPLRYRLIGNEKAMTNKISDILSHELMHGNIFLKRFENKVEINDAPEYYGNLLRILENEDQENDLYQIAFALYSTYYHEVQAFTSQTAKSIKDIYGGKLTYSNDEIKNGIMQSEGYMIYSNIINGKVKDIIDYEDLVIETYILPRLNDYGVSFNVEELRASLCKAVNVAKKALHKIFKNAMLLKIEPRVRF